jgi:hypothetical protein
MRTLYRCLLRLYPTAHRDCFGQEMAAVFREVQGEAAKKGRAARIRFYVRETAGLLLGAVREHLREFPNRRSAMRTEFRFPKATAVLMMIILAGVVLAIEKGKAIQASLPAVNPSIGLIQPAQHTFLPVVAIVFLFFYAVGLIGWALLFALRRSGVHRLAEIASEQK